MDIQGPNPKNDNLLKEKSKTKNGMNVLGFVSFT